MDSSALVAKGGRVMRYKENKKNSENINSFRFFEAACMRSAFYIQRPDLIFLHTNTPDLRNGGKYRQKTRTTCRALLFSVSSSWGGLALFLL